MQDARITYYEFTDRFLIWLAILTAGDFDIRVDVHEVAANIGGYFPQSWIREGRKNHIEDRGIRYNFDDDTISITPGGLDKAEKLSSMHGINIWDKIRVRDQVRTSESIENQNDLLASDDGGSLLSGIEFEGATSEAVIKVDRSNQAFLDLDRQLSLTIEELKRNNLIVADDESAQRLAELQAGSALLNSPSAGIALINRLIVSPLKWFATKVRDESASHLIKLALTAATLWLLGH